MSLMADKRWHLNKNGEPAVCTAMPGNCPLGGEHYGSLREATIAAEAATKTRFENASENKTQGVLSKKTRVVLSKPIVVTDDDVKKAASAGMAIMSKAREAFGVPLPPKPKTNSPVPLLPRPKTDNPVPLPPRQKPGSPGPVPLPPRPQTDRLNPPTPPKPLDLMDPEKPVAVGFLPEFDLKQKNAALARFGQLRPDLSYTGMMGDKQCTAARYNKYVERLEDRLKTDDDARNALSAAVDEVRWGLLDPPRPRRQVMSRSKMWELLS